MIAKKKKKAPKVYTVYALDFADGRVYFGETSNLKVRERQHKKKWAEPFVLRRVSDYNQKGRALAAEQWLVLSMYFDEPKRLRNRFCNRFTLPGAC